MVSDGDWRTRMNVAEHRFAPEEALIKLLADDDPFVNGAALRNPNTTLPVLANLARSDSPIAERAAKQIRKRFSRSDLLRHLGWVAEEYEGVPDSFLLAAIY
jgi:hypothetical protein